MVLEFSKESSGEFIFVCTEESEMGALFRYYIPRTKYHKMFCPMPEFKNSFYVINFGRRKVTENWVKTFMEDNEEEILEKLNEKKSLNRV